MQWNPTLINFIVIMGFFYCPNLREEMKQEHSTEVAYPNAVMIFFRDLKKSKQKKLLKLLKTSNPVLLRTLEKNWDVFPLTIIGKIESEN